jgi:threonylcarbamoyladenosine tRNA methylthiotransferase CDKAL1
LGNSREAEEELIRLGHISSSLDEAEVVVINTCVVTEKTERKILRRLCQLQGRGLVIAGCFAIVMPRSLEGIACSKVVGILNRSTAMDLLGPAIIDALPSPSRQIKDGLCGVVNIAEGWPYAAESCAASWISIRPDKTSPFAASTTSSMGLLLIFPRAFFTAQYLHFPTQDYGRHLPELIDAIADIPGRFMVRVGMMNPDTAWPILGQLIESYRDPKIYKFIHLPVQSGSNRVLRAMGRSSGRPLMIST